MHKSLRDHVISCMPKHAPRFTVVKDCTFEQAVARGFSGTPERWEEVKRKYTEDVLERHGEGVQIDYTNILFDGQGMQDSDGHWHRFPK